MTGERGTQRLVCASIAAVRLPLVRFLVENLGHKSAQPLIARIVMHLAMPMLLEHDADMKCGVTKTIFG
jgi:hypothetical protein